MKMAKPVGLMVKCPHCGGYNEIESDDLQQNGIPCQYANCGKEFATCGDDDFIRYIKQES